MRDFALTLTILVVILLLLLVSLFIRIQQIASVEYECLSYGYPQFRTGNNNVPSYCIRRVFETDEVRTLEELRMKGKGQ